MEYDDDLNQVIERIRKIRIEKKISQFELATKANFSQSFLANVENGKKKPSVMTIIRIAKALDVNPREFFPEKHPQKTKDDIKKEIISLLDCL